MENNLNANHLMVDREEEEGEKAILKSIVKACQSQGKNRPDKTTTTTTTSQKGTC